MCDVSVLRFARCVLRIAGYGVRETSYSIWDFGLRIWDCFDWGWSRFAIWDWGLVYKRWKGSRLGLKAHWAERIALEFSELPTGTLYAMRYALCLK